MSIWTWFTAYEAQARSNPSSPIQLKMFEEFWKGTNSKDSVFRLSQFQQAREIAASIQDDEFALWCDAWIGMATARVNDYKTSLQVLSKAAVRSRDRRFDGLPQKIMVNVLAIDRMGDVDPLGYLTEIEKGLEHLDKICVDEPEHSCVYLGNMTWIYNQLGYQAKAVKYYAKFCQAIIAGSSKTYDSRRNVLGALLCKTEGKWDEVLNFADRGLPLAQSQESEALFHYFRANALVHLDDLVEAKMSLSRGQKIEVSEDIDRYQLITEYYLATDSLEKAIETRLRQLEDCVGMSRYWEQANAALHLVELYCQAGDREKATCWKDKTIELCEPLRNPTPVLESVELVFGQLG